jgi:hypothetical protein
MIGGIASDLGITHGAHQHQGRRRASWIPRPEGIAAQAIALLSDVLPAYNRSRAAPSRV